MCRFKASVPIRGHNELPFLFRNVLLRFWIVSEKPIEQGTPDQWQCTVNVENCLPSEPVEYQTRTQDGDHGTKRCSSVDDGEPRAFFFVNNPFTNEDVYYR